MSWLNTQMTQKCADISVKVVKIDSFQCANRKKKLIRTHRKCSRFFPFKWKKHNNNNNINHTNEPNNDRLNKQCCSIFAELGRVYYLERIHWRIDLAHGFQLTCTTNAIRRQMMKKSGSFTLSECVNGGFFFPSLFYWCWRKFSVISQCTHLYISNRNCTHVN